VSLETYFFITPQKWILWLGGIKIQIKTPIKPSLSGSIFQTLVQFNIFLMIGEGIITDCQRGILKTEIKYCRVKDLCCLVEIARRIDRIAVDPHFIMEMGPGAIAREANRTDDLSFLDFISGLDIEFFQVAVHGKKTVTMVDTNQSSIL
jgi:hypothetical protein